MIIPGDVYQPIISTQVLGITVVARMEAIHEPTALTHLG